MARLLLTILFIGFLSAVSSAKRGFPERPDIVIGIDLGTTYSRVGACLGSTGEIKIIPNDQGNFMTPSLIAFTDTETFIGEAAMNQTAVSPESTISFDATRLIGRKFDDIEVQSARKLVPYNIVNKDGKPYILVKINNGESKLFSPEEITAMFLTKMKETAEAFLGKEIKDAVITIPTYFNDAQRQAIKDAGTMAGLKVLRLLQKPKAAAKAYDLDWVIGEQNILVFDLGGGTFDVTVFAADYGVLEILATNTDTHLGGNNFDRRVMEYFMTMIKKKHGKDISKDNTSLVKLRRECERAKRALSNQQQVQIEIESLFNGVNFSEPLTRAQFEELNNDLFSRTIGTVKKVIEEAGLKKRQINDIVLVGGSTNIPKLRQLLKDYFDESEANMAVESEIDEIVLVGGSTKIPKFRPIFKDYFDGKEANNGLEPGEAVAIGIATMGGALSRHAYCNEFENHHWIGPFGALRSFSYRVRTAGGVMTKLIPGFNVIPLRSVQVFTTNRDNQTRISIEIYDGKNTLTKKCKLLGKFELTGIPPAPRGTPRIEITTTIDSEDYIDVKAEDKSTGKSEKITFPNPTYVNFIKEWEHKRASYEEQENEHTIRE